LLFLTNRDNVTDFLPLILFVSLNVSQKFIRILKLYINTTNSNKMYPGEGYGVKLVFFYVSLLDKHGFCKEILRAGSFLLSRGEIYLHGQSLS